MPILKRISWRLSILLFLCQFVHSQSSANSTNFIINGGFETGKIAPWQCISNTSTGCGLESTSTGGFANTGSINAFITSGNELRQPLAIEAGKYDLIFSIYCVQCAGASQNVIVALGPLRLFGTADLGSTSFGPYRVFSHTFNAGKGDILRFGYNDTGRLRIDDVSFRIHKAVSTSASSVNTAVLVGAIAGGVVALAVCIGGIFFLRRRRRKKRSSMGSGPQKEKGTKVAISYPKKGHPSWIRPLNDQSVFVSFERQAASQSKQLPRSLPTSSDGHGSGHGRTTSRTYQSFDPFAAEFAAANKHVSHKSSSSVNHRPTQSWSQSHQGHRSTYSLNDQIQGPPFPTSNSNFGAITNNDIILPRESIDINRPLPITPTTSFYQPTRTPPSARTPPTPNSRLSPRERDENSIVPPVPHISILDSDQYSMRTTNIEYIAARSRPLEERDFYPQYPRLQHTVI
ncbi:hypothetical protein BT69DRAFT_1352158 [Atractiella rhizophila]|nr:hypothetical protein BT69DRAFT_1352158 [Atractiella rhizophila]